MQVEKWRKKPVEVEAVFFGQYLEAPAIVKWVTDNGGTATYGQAPNEGVKIHLLTMEGLVQAEPGEHWIVRGVEGEFYPCRSSIFRGSHERVDEPEPESQREMPPVVAGAGYCYPTNPRICSGCGAVAPFPHYRSCTAVG